MRGIAPSFWATVLATVLLACAGCRSLRNPEPPPTPAAGSTGKEETQVTETIRIRETTQHALSGHLVAVGNIFERELPGPDGVVAERLSANLEIRPEGGGPTTNQKVIVGSIVTIGGDRYRVESIEEGDEQPGALTLGRLAR